MLKEHELYNILRKDEWIDFKATYIRNNYDSRYFEDLMWNDDEKSVINQVEYDFEAYKSGRKVAKR